jgi:hypothetical protein
VGLEMNLKCPEVLVAERTRSLTFIFEPEAYVAMGLAAVYWLAMEPPFNVVEEPQGTEGN